MTEERIDKSCLRCGQCCHLPYNGSIGFKKCKYLEKIEEGKYQCKIYEKRLNVIMGEGMHMQRRTMYKCAYRENALFNYPGCPNNVEGKIMIRIRGKK